MRKFLGFAAVAAAMMLFIGSAQATMGKTVPTFKLKAIDGSEITQEVLKENVKKAGGKVVLIFSQMACRQCQQEMKAFSEQADALKGKVFVVLVDMNPDAGKAGYEKQGYKLPVIMDPEYSIPSALNLTTTPSTVVIDKDLNVIWFKVGYRAGQIEEIKNQL